MVTYLVFIGKRVFRIVPLLVVVGLAGTLYCNFIDRRMHYPFATDWFTEKYKLDVDLPRLLASFTGYSARPAAPMWSTFVELCGSLLLPFMAWTMRSRVPAWLLGIFLVGLGCFSWTGFAYRWPVFLISFYLGLSLVYWGEACVRKLGSGATALAGLTFCACLWWFFRRLAGGEIFDALPALVQSLAVTPLIAYIYYAPVRGEVWLRNRVLVYLGTISYSLYLVHFPILCGWIQLLATLVPPLTIAEHQLGFVVLTMAVTAGASIAVAALTYRWVEMPFIALGKKSMAKFAVLAKNGGYR